MPVTSVFTSNGGSLRFEVKDPARDQAAEDGYVGDDDGDVIFDVIDAVINWVGPVGFEETVDTIAIGEVNFSSTDGGYTDMLLAKSFRRYMFMHNLRQAGCEYSDDHKS